MHSFRKSLDKHQIQPCSNDFTVQLSFDMAQQVHIPSNPLQAGPLYFLTPFRVSIFGIMNDTFRQQANYLIPESCSTGKGANMIINFLHHYLTERSTGERVLFLQADNCRAQNKNNIMMAYLCMRTMLNLHSEITISFMVPGHTKFSCDWAFGILKSNFRRNEVSSLEKLKDVITDSTPNSKLNQAILVGDVAGKRLYLRMIGKTIFRRSSIHASQ